MQLNYRSSILILSALFAASCQNSNEFVNCEQLSTVFVLETSDSSSNSDSIGSNEAEQNAFVAPVSAARSAKLLNDDSGTRIITDQSSPPIPVVQPKQQQQATSSHSNQGEHSRHLQHQSQPQQQQTQQHNNVNKQANHHNSTGSSHQQSSQPAHHTVSSSSNHGQQNSNAHHGSSNSHETSHSNTHSNQNSNQQQQHHSNPKHAETNTNAHPKPSIRSTSASNQQAAHTSQAGSRHKPTTSSSTTAYEYSDYSASSTSTTRAPKIEERLLISITSEDDEEEPSSSSSSSSSSSNFNKPPKKSIVTTQQDGEQSAVIQLPQSNGNRRKPSITISIQDANLGKQENGSPGGGGTPAVIVRPSENGQSIVISTVNKHSSKPAIILTPSSSSSSSSGNSNNNINNNDPNDPPIVISSQYTSTTTFRPSLISNNENYNNKPITSTLIDSNRPPVSAINDDRPQRPTASDDAYSDQRPVTSRPPVNRPPPQQPPTSAPQDQGNDGLDTSVNQPATSSQSEEYNKNPNQPKYPLNEKNCGLVHETRIVGGEEANPDDFLWMAAIIKSKPTDGEARPFCGGSLISRRHILTAAHCLENLAPRDVLVRLGSYDFDDSTASSLSADYAIDQFRVPAHYSKKTHVADIAIMRLKTPLAPTDNYKTVCMPQPRRSYVGALGTVTGYGSQSQTFRKAAPKLRQVTVPIWENRKCSAVYKKNLTESYLCAGYEEGGKDACQGDSGGPLMTEGPNERMMIVGVVSHGIGCGSPGYPGVYTRTTTYLDWIEKNTRE